MDNLYRKEVTAAELGEELGLSERMIREHRAHGRVFRLGKGYDFKRSFLGVVDHHRIEAAKRGVGEPGQTLAETYADLLRYRASLADERDGLRFALDAILALPGIPDEARAIAREHAPRPHYLEDDDDKDNEGEDG